MNCHDPDSLYFIFLQVIRFHYYRTHLLLEKIGAYPGQPPLLFALGKQDGLSQKELAEKLHIKAATITIMLTRMEKTKLIKRCPDPDDQRVTRVYLTKHGEKIHTEVKAALKVIENECFYNFTSEEQLFLRRLFLQMRDNLAKVCGKNLGE